MQEKIIAAISTPQGVGGIAVIRISGKGSDVLCDRIFRGREKLENAASHTIHYGHIVVSGEIIDEVLVSVMRSPRTYTGEDVVEINTHGGMVASRRVLEEIIKLGASPAEPGEFTKRAFLNGRIDLSSAEGVIDIINAKTTLAGKNALSHAGGALAKAINAIKADLVNLAAAMQVAIDYPDEDLEDVTASDILAAVRTSLSKCQKLIKSADSGKIITEGIKTAIVGKPNVGKSSLLNLLAMEERAIVTDIAGTTRDIIEETVTLSGVPLRLLDTAGIHDTEDAVEKIGVERSKAAINDADLVILIIDISRDLSCEDRLLLELTADKNRIIIANKTDIKILDFEGAIEISAKTGEGIEELSAKIKEMYDLGAIAQNDAVIVTNMRHLEALIGATDSLLLAEKAVSSGLPQDLAALDIYDAIDSLGKITGDTVSEEIVAEIFASFCVGK